MKYLTLLIVILVLFSGKLVAMDFEDVIYLKSGEIIRGIIVEQVPNKSVKIQTYSGNEFIYQIDEIEKITKEELKRRRAKKLLSSDKQVGVNFGNEFLCFPKNLDYLTLSLKTNDIGIHTFKLHYSSSLTNNFYYAGLISFGYNYCRTEHNYSFEEQDSEIKSSIIGFSSELEIFYSNYLSPLSNFKLFYGIGFGYYNYTNSIIENFGETENDKYEAKISGIAQSFIFGCQLDVTSKISANLKFQKLGLSLLTIEFENLTETFEPAFKYSENIVSSPDLEDLGISIGISYKL